MKRPTFFDSRLSLPLRILWKALVWALLIALFRLGWVGWLYITGMGLAIVRRAVERMGGEGRATQFERKDCGVQIPEKIAKLGKRELHFRMALNQVL